MGIVQYPCLFNSHRWSIWTPTPPCTLTRKRHASRHFAAMCQAVNPSLGLTSCDCKMTISPMGGLFVTRILNRNLFTLGQNKIKKEDCHRGFQQDKGHLVTPWGVFGFVEAFDQAVFTKIQVLSCTEYSKVGWAWLWANSEWNLFEDINCWVLSQDMRPNRAICCFCLRGIDSRSDNWASDLRTVSLRHIRVSICWSDSEVCASVFQQARIGPATIHMKID